MASRRSLPAYIIHALALSTGSARVAIIQDGRIFLTSSNVDYIGTKRDGSAYTEILYSPLGKTAIMNGQTLTKAFVNLPGGGTAIYNASGLAYYRHADWLSSARLTSTPSRGLYWWRRKGLFANRR